MARMPNLKRLGDHEALKKSSGWYLAAWRDFRGLTLEEVADAIGTSKSVVSELEASKQKRDGSKPLRYNRDWVDLLAKALEVSPGHLVDVNPYKANVEALDLFGKVPLKDRPRVLQIIKAFTDQNG